MCINQKSYVIIFDSFCVVLLVHFDFFECFYCYLPCLIWFFTKTRNFHFYDQIKPKADTKFNPPIKCEQQTRLETSQTK